MKKLLFTAILLLSLSRPTFAASKHLGEILLDVENHGEAWYVNPADSKRYFLGRPEDAFRVVQTLGVGVEESKFAKLATSSTSTPEKLKVNKSLAGKFIIRAENRGEIWYVNPRTLKMSFLGCQAADVLAGVRAQGIGIKQSELAFIHKPGIDESINQYSKYQVKNVTTRYGKTFKADIIEIDLSNPKLKIVTDTADTYNCKKNCKARTLADFAFKNKGFAAINGTYFCSSSGCEAMNYYFFPVYNSNTCTLINEDQLKWWTTGPMMVFDTNNKFYYFRDSRDFKSVADFEKKNGVKLQAAIGNKPRLIENFMNQLIDWEVDAKQKNAKVLRNAIGYKDGKIYLVVTRKSTVDDLAEVLRAMGMEYALNLDGGYSTALLYNGEYMLGPGRNVPNAIVFKEVE